MRITRLKTLAVAAILLALGAGVAPAHSEEGDDSSGFWDVEESEKSATTEANPGDSSCVPCANGDRESNPQDSVAVHRNDEDSDPETWGDEDWDDDDWTGGDLEPIEWDSEEAFFDRCHGIVSCTFTVAGELISLPFRILGVVFQIIF